MAVHKIQGPDGRVHRIEAPADADPSQLVSFLEEQLVGAGPSEAYSALRPDYGLFEGAGKGLSRGFSRLGSTVTDILPALGGAALGFDDYAREQLAEAAAKEEELQRVNPAEYQSFRDVEGITDVPGFIMETIGEQAANILPSLAGGLGLGALGARTAATAATKGIVEKELRDAALQQAAGQIARRQATGQLAGAAAGSYALNAPEIFQNIYEETGELAPGAAAAFSTAAAALDSILPAQLARSLTGPMKVGVAEALLARTGMDRGMLRKMAAGVLGGATTEAPTEAAQEAISIAAERFVAENPEAFTEREIERLKESFVRGAVAGGGLSAVGAVPEGVRESAAVAQERAEAGAAAEAADDLGPPPTGVAPTPVESVEPAAPSEAEMDEEVEAAAPEPTVRAAPAAPAPATPRAREILRRMGYNEELVNDFSQAQATAIIEQRAPEMVDYLDESVALPEETAPATAPAEPAGPTPQEELDTLKREVERSEAEGAARDAVQEELVQEPAPRAEPDTLIPTDPAALKAWGRANLGVGPSANLFKAGASGFIGGKDLSDPGQAAEVRATLEQYARGRSPSIKAKVDEFLTRPEFQVQPEEVVDELQTPDAQEAQPVEAEPQAEAAVAQAAPAQAEPQAEESVAGQQDFDEFLEAERAAADELISREVQLTQTPVDEEGNRITEDAVEVSDQYRGTNTHNAFMLARLLSAYSRQKQAAERAEPGKKRAAQAKLKPIAEELQKLKVDTKALERLSPAQLQQGIEAANSNARNRLRLMQYGEDAQSYALEKAAASPKLEGDLLAAVQAGNLKQTISLLLGKTTKRPEIQQILRKIQSLGLKTKIVESPLGRPGEYDPVTDTITLDPELGLNEHALIHELSHAALAKRIADPKSKEAKAFGEFFQIMKNQLGGTYGGTDVQEFAAEIMGNEQFAASTKAIKAPKSGTLWDRIVQTIAEFFGFRKGQSVYDAGIKYINELLNVLESAEPTLSEKLYLTGDMNGSVGKVWSGVKFSADETLGKLSNLDLNWRTFALGAASLNNMSRMFGKVLPIAALEQVLETKRGYVDNAVEALNSRVRDINKTLKDVPQATIDKANKLFIDMRIEGVDVLGIDPNYKASANPAQHKKYMDAFNALPAPVKAAYRTMRTDLRASMEQFAELIRTQVGGATGKQLAEEFMNLDGVIGYVPFRRVGDYWVSYTDPETKEPVVRAFPYKRDQQRLIADLKAQGVEASAYINMETGKAPQNLPPNTFVAKIIAGLRSSGASEATVDQVWQQYAEMFPARSIMQQMKRSKNRLGMDEDIVGAYADTQIKWVNKLANMQYNPQVDAALVGIEEAAKQNKSDPNIVAAAKNILDQKAFYTNPQFHPITNALTQGSYIFMILGSLAASLVNLTGLPFLVGPTLAGRFGLSATSSAMMDAARIAHRDNWGSGKYKALYETLNARGLLKHTLTREALERGRTKGSDFQSVYSRVVEFFSIPFQASEKYARAVTVMSAYDLALKGNKDLGVALMSQEEAIEYAARMVKNTHTAGMVEVAPRFFQNDIGRVALTFKQIMFQQAAHVGFILRKAWKGVPTPENATAEEIAGAERERKVAMRQALGIYGTAFVFLGANGVPFGSALGTFLQIVNVASGGLVAVLFGMDEDEPFDPTVAASELFGDVFHKGLANSLLQIELSDRAGIANDILFRDAPEDVEQFGLVRTVLASLAGPMLGQAIMAERGFEYFQEGKVDRALETVSPVFIRNGLRTFRFIAEDGARTADGLPIEEDLNAWNLFTQLIGFTPSELSDTYAQRSAAKRVDTAIIARKQRIQDMYFTGRTTGDQALVREAREEAAAFRRRYPQLMDGDTLDRSYRAKLAAQREMLRGIRYTKGLKAELQERFDLGN